MCSYMVLSHVSNYFNIYHCETMQSIKNYQKQCTLITILSKIALVVIMRYNNWQLHSVQQFICSCIPSRVHNTIKNKNVSVNHNTVFYGFLSNNRCKYFTIGICTKPSVFLNILTVLLKAPFQYSILLFHSIVLFHHSIPLILYTPECFYLDHFIL